MIEERVESEVQQHALRLAQTGAGLALRIGEKTAVWFLRQGSDRIRDLRHSVGNSIRQARQHERMSGRMSEKRLQQVSGGDLHVVEFDHDQVRTIVASLEKSGVRYAVERGPVSTWIHFEGKNLDHVTHAVRRALHDAGYELQIDGEKTQAKEPEHDQAEQERRTPDEAHHDQPGQNVINEHDRDDPTPPKMRNDEQTEQMHEIASDTKDMPRTRKISKAQVLHDLHERIKEKIRVQSPSSARARKRDRTHTR